MVIVKLEHAFVTIAHERGIFEGVDNMSGLVKAISRHAKEAFPSKEEEDQCNKFKGDAFEVFGEYLIKANPHDERVGITDYCPNQGKDMGVDGSGTGHDENPAAVQFKFREKPAVPLYYHDLATFGNDALANFGIIARGEAQRKNELFEGLVSAGVLTKGQSAAAGYPFKHSMHNLLVVATTYETYHTWDQVNGGSRFLGWEHLTYLTRNKPLFWEGFRASIRSSALVPKERARRVLKHHQLEAGEQVTKFLESDSERAQVIIPSGGGKTTVAHEAIERSIEMQDSPGGIYIYISPRIALTLQNLHEIWSLKRSPWVPICVCSGKSETLEYYENDKYIHIEPTTHDSSILRAIQSTEGGSDVVFFVTNHSVLKIGRVLQETGRIARLVIGDEAHNLTATNFGEALDILKLPTKKWLFFTATRKVGESSSGRGMNNSDRFGEVIYNVPPVELIRQGMIVPPRLHSVRILDPAEIVGEGRPKVKDQLALIIGGIRRHQEEVSKYGSSAIRVIVFCQGANDAHDFAESEALKKHLPEFYMAAVTSISERMRDTRKNIFDSFSESEHSILFHYDVVSEGIDLPGATGILPLRGLGPIKATQGIGRTLRLTKRDRIALAVGEIAPGDPKGWAKPYGWVILPWIPGLDLDDVERVKGIVQAVRQEDYGKNTEELVCTYEPAGSDLDPPEFDPVSHPEHVLDSAHDFFSWKDLLSKVYHAIESEESVRYRNFIDARDWARGLGISNWPEWRKYTESESLPWDIPSNPEEIYADLGWRGSKDWLGF